MKPDVEKSLRDCLKKFKNNENINSVFKRVLIKNIGLEEKFLLPFILDFISIAKEKNYEYSLALGDTFLFMIELGKDLDLATTHNERARLRLMSNETYKKSEAMLTVLNNAVLINLLKGDYKEAYNQILTAIPLSKSESKLAYYSAFINNGSLILSEFGLYKKATQEVEENLSKRNYLGDSIFYTTFFVLCNLYLYIKDTKKLYTILELYLDEIKALELYDANCFYKLYLEGAILDDNQETADKYYQTILDTYSFEHSNAVDTDEIYLSIARYHVYRKKFDVAKPFYDRLLESIDNILGQKRTVYEEAANVYMELGQFKQAYTLLK